MTAGFSTELFILASNSESRIKLLQDAGYNFKSLPANIDEKSIREAFIRQDVGTSEISSILAEAKSSKIIKLNADILVIGSDQILELDRKILSKPTNKEEAFNQIRKLQGTEHRLHTAAVAMINNTPVWRHVSTSKLLMRTMNDNQIELYLDDCWRKVKGSAGGYHIETEGLRLFRKISGNIHDIMGFPLVEFSYWFEERKSIWE